MPMNGVRCATCASGVEIRHKLWDTCKNISFFRQPCPVPNHDSLLFSKLLSFPAVSQPQEENDLELREVPFQMLIRVDSENSWPLKREEFRVLEDCWYLPFECLQPAPENQTLEIAHCRIRTIGDESHFHADWEISQEMVLRFAEDSIFYTLLVSSNLKNLSVRCCWLTTNTKKEETAERIEWIEDIIERLRRTGSYSRHPLLVPVLTLEKELQTCETQFALPLSPVTHRIDNVLDHIINRSIYQSTNLNQENIQQLNEGIHDYYRIVASRRVDIGHLKTTLRTLVRGSAIIRSNISLDSDDAEAFECVDDRLDLFGSRLEILEERMQQIIEEIGNLNTMLYNLVNQQDSRLNFSIAKDSRKIAFEAKKDSSAMKVIAFITMSLLPGTFVATLFSTGLFKFKDPDSNNVVSSQFWIYWAFTIPLTAVMFGYSFFTFRVEIRNTLERTFGLENANSSSRTMSLGTTKNHKSKRVEPPPIIELKGVQESWVIPGRQCGYCGTCC